MNSKPPPPLDTWSALRHAAFRVLWQSGGLYFVANAMQTMAAAWMMVELTGSSFLSALVQTAVFLPMFLLSLPAGVLADITDRRRLIIGALAVQAVTGTLLSLLLFAGIGGPATLLFFVFVAGACTAMLSPAWNSTVADSVPRDELPNAITAVSIAYNGARAVGPALAGVVISLAGSTWNFVITVIGSLIMLQAIRRWPPKPHPPSRLPAERLWGGMLAGLRFARHSHTVLSQLVRTVAYSGAGSALWALLPVIGQRQLGLGAAGVGLLVGCMGGGAVAAGLVIGRLRATAGLERLVAGGCVAYAGVMLVAAFSTQKAAGLSGAGAGWRSLDGGDVHLQHRHADQRADVGARAGAGHAHAVRAGRLCHLLGLLGRTVRHRQPELRAQRGGGLHGRRAAAGQALPAAHGRGRGGDGAHTLGRLLRRR